MGLDITQASGVPPSLSQLFRRLDLRLTRLERSTRFVGLAAAHDLVPGVGNVPVTTSWGSPSGAASPSVELQLPGGRAFVLAVCQVVIALPGGLGVNRGAVEGRISYSGGGSGATAPSEAAIERSDSTPEVVVRQRLVVSRLVEGIEDTTAPVTFTFQVRGSSDEPLAASLVVYDASLYVQSV